MRQFVVFCGAVFCLGAWGQGNPAEQRVLLVAGNDTNMVAQGLRALGVPHERISTAAYAGQSPFHYDLIIWGFDESRAVLEAHPEQMAAFVQSGGFLLCFRRNAADPWLPVGMTRGKAYQFGRILAPEHPVFTAPHPMTNETMREVHGGSIYDAFSELGSGWTPLISTGDEQRWDKREPHSDGPHYGMVELKHGQGRILLVQTIPAYHWFKDREGDSEAAGAKLFENLVRYALAQAPARAATRPPALMPESFARDLADVLAASRRGDGLPMDQDWEFSAKGPYTMKTDRRGVLTFTHADAPSTAGNFAQVSRTVAVPDASAQVMLRWYVSDTYCGGRERILGGADHGKTAAMNVKKDMRFAQVLVNDRPVWEEDVLGRNPQPASRRVRMLDVTEAIRSTSGPCRIALRVEDRGGSGEERFAIDVFWAAVEIIPDVIRLPAAEAFQREGVRADSDTGILTLEQDKTVLRHRCTVPSGRYRVAIELRDGVYGRSTLRLRRALRTIGQWTLTADDHGWYWAVSQPVDLRPGRTLTLTAVRDGAEKVLLRGLAVIPERLIRTDDTQQQDLPAQQVRTPFRVEFPVTVTETAGMDRNGEVTAQGMPFARGSLGDLEQIEIHDANGDAVPVQTRTVATWPDDSIKVALVCFPAQVSANGTARYRVSTGRDRRAALPDVPLMVTEEPGHVRIDTGRIIATLSTAHGRIVEEVRRDAALVKDAGQVWELVIEDENGRILRSGGETVSETRVVDGGPLRALIVRRGTFADDLGSAIEYRLQLEATAGSDALGLEMTIVNREDVPDVYLRRWSMRIEHAEAASGSAWLDHNEFRNANVGAVLYQHREDTLSWTGTDRAFIRGAHKSPGYARLPGLAIGTRWFWQRFPQAIRFEERQARFDFIPPAFDELDLPTRWRDRMLEVTDKYPVGGVGYPQSPGKMGLFRLAQGEALSQEIRFVFDGAEPTAPVAEPMAPLAARLRAVPDPVHTSTTRAFGQLHPGHRQHFPHYEESVDRLYENYMAKREKRREYGFENFGDDTFEWGYGPSYTYWSNAEYDPHHGFAIQYLRSADPKWWEICEQQARMYRDVVVIHHAPQDRLWRGGPRHHNATSQWMPQHEEQHWIADHTRCGPSAGHSWVQGMIDYWFLTGDPWSEEVVHGLAGWYCDIAENQRFGAGGQERGPGWALIAISALANALGGERIQQAGWTIADWIIEWQDPIRGVVSVPISEQPSYEGGSTFMHGIVGRGLGRWYEVTADPRVKEACIGIAEWITTEPMGPPARWWYKQSPNNSKRFGATSQCLNALTYAHEMSGDPWFADIAMALLRQTGAGIRTISWYPQALDQLVSQVCPAEVVVTPNELVVSPEQPGELEVTVRNTTDRDLAAWLTSERSAPFEFAELSRITLAPGQSSKVPVRLLTTGFPARAELWIEAHLAVEGAAPVVRRLRISARAVQQIVCLESDIEQAQLTAPMVLAGQGSSVYAHTPRGPDFVAEPHPKDGEGGGWAVWTFDIPAKGDYTVAGEVYWLDGEGNSFFLSVNDGPESVFGNHGTMQRWIWIEQSRIHLTRGKHSVRVRSREDGSRIRRLRLTVLSGE